MRPQAMVFSGHMMGFVLIMTGFWWFLSNLSILPGYGLVVALATLSGLVVNHFRWWHLEKSFRNREVLGEVNYLIVSNNVVTLLLFILLNFNR